MKCELKKGISSKTNKEYFYLEIALTPTYIKKVFLDNAEVELIMLTTQK